MKTVREYVNLLGDSEWHRHRPERWVSWANSLLEKLSGADVLPPQRLTRGVVVRDGSWIDRPPRCREVLTLESSARTFRYNFHEENGALRVAGAQFSPPELRKYPILDRTRTGIVLDNENAKLATGFLDGWLFVVTAGAGWGMTYRVSRSEVSGVDDNRLTVQFLNETNLETHDDGDEPIIGDGHFVHPQDYLILSYVAAFEPVVSMSNFLGIEDRDNLVEAWFRWKCEEQAQSMSQDCAYWGNKFDAELAALRGEMHNRVNKSAGRSLPGFQFRR